MRGQDMKDLTERRCARLLIPAMTPCELVYKAIGALPEGSVLIASMDSVQEFGDWYGDMAWLVYCPSFPVVEHGQLIPAVTILIENDVVRLELPEATSPVRSTVAEARRIRTLGEVREDQIQGAQQRFREANNAIQN